ncbi:MAG TPA: HhH-GPD-type base excision DNA repair protein [Candidatus Dormibacteraeota bacterium]|jgi:uncharacterized HhH-GPD family protein|nr:HhH-GPD-type base excision DNA repair protein [Candidatus Dormibacteraeota bacterium]
MSRTATVAPGAPARLPWSGDDEADRLIAADPNALLIGFVLDQQVTVQKAFSGPPEIRRRLGTLDPGKLAAMDPQKVRDAFAKPPAVHRFPGAMADRVRALCELLATEYGGDASRLWREAATADDLKARLGRLPGIGPMKARTILGLLAKQFGVRPPGWEKAVPDFPTLADVTTSGELAEYQAHKRAWKAEMRAQGIDPGKHTIPKRPAGAARAKKS